MQRGRAGPPALLQPGLQGGGDDARRDQDARRREGRDADAGRDGTDTSYVVNTVSFGAGESIDAIFTAPPHSGGGGRTCTSSTTENSCGRTTWRPAASGGSGPRCASTPPARWPRSHPQHLGREERRTCAHGDPMERGGASRDTSASRSCRLPCWPAPGLRPRRCPPWASSARTDPRRDDADVQPDHEDGLHQPSRRHHRVHVGLLGGGEPLPAPEPRALCERGRDRHRRPDQHLRPRTTSPSSSRARRASSPTGRRPSPSSSGAPSYPSPTWRRKPAVA